MVICDTSGRLHTNIGLMEELAKCKRSISKRMEGAPHETLLILDGTTGALLSHTAAGFLLRDLSWSLAVLKQAEYLLWDTAVCLVGDLQYTVQSDSREALLWGKVMIKSEYQ